MSLCIRVLFFLLGLTAMVASAATTTTSAAKKSFTDQQKAAIETIVHDYLLANPQVLLEVSQKLQAKEQAKLEDKVKSVIETQQAQVFFDKNTPVLGNPSGDIQLVEFFDYQCIHCKEEGPVLANLIKANPQLRVVLKDLPIFGRNSRYATLASLAVYRMAPKDYERFHRALLANEGALTEEKVQSIAKTMGIDNKQLTDAMKATDLMKQVDSNYQLADAIGISGTPAFILAKTIDANAVKDKVSFIAGAADQKAFQRLIDQLQAS